MSGLTRDGVAGCLFSLKGKSVSEIKSTLRSFLIGKGLGESECGRILDDLASYPEYQPQGEIDES